MARSAADAAAAARFALVVVLRMAVSCAAIALMADATSSGDCASKRRRFKSARRDAGIGFTGVSFAGRAGVP